MQQQLLELQTDFQTLKDRVDAIEKSFGSFRHRIRSVFTAKSQKDKNQQNAESAQEVKTTKNETKVRS